MVEQELGEPLPVRILVVHRGGGIPAPAPALARRKPHSRRA